MFDRIFFAPSFYKVARKSEAKILTAYLFYFPDDPSSKKIKRPQDTQSPRGCFA